MILFNIKNRLKTPSPLKLDLDPQEARRNKAQRTRLLNVYQIPVLRVLGLLLLPLFMYLNNTFVVGSCNVLHFKVFTAAAMSYSLLSWLILYLAYDRIKWLDLGVLFLALDNIFIIFAIYLTGAEKSLLFIMLLVRTSDQTGTYFLRALFFTHLSVLSYFLLMVYIVFVEGRPIEWGPELVKMGLIYFCGIYISLAARTAEKIRRRTRESMKIAQSLIKELERKGRQLKAAIKQAKAANTAKTRFLANVSHEIRTPLNAIIGMTRLTLDSKLSPDQLEQLEAVNNSSQHLLFLINEILDISKIEAGKVELESLPFNLARAIQGLVQQLSGTAQDKDLELTCLVDPEIPPVLLGDGLRLRQVIYNLLSNALKFTERGRVDLEVKTVGGSAQAVFLLFRVSDTGIGIAKEKQKDIFNPFTQADSSTTRRYGGTGLGLAIASQLIGLMGGTMGLESYPGRGSTFYFTLELGLTGPGQASGQSLDQADPPPAQTGQPARMNILLVEDIPLNQLLARKLLEKQGHSVVVADDGQKAVEIYQHQAFDLIFMDVQMPVMDGMEATGHIRRLESAGKGHVPIVAMTAHAMKGYKQRCLAAGMDGYLAKPLDPEELSQLLESVRAGLFLA